MIKVNRNQAMLQFIHSINDISDINNKNINRKINNMEGGMND